MVSDTGVAACSEADDKALDPCCGRDLDRQPQGEGRLGLLAELKGEAGRRTGLADRDIADRKLRDGGPVEPFREEAGRDRGRQARLKLCCRSLQEALFSLVFAVEGAQAPVERLGPDQFPQLLKEQGPAVIADGPDGLRLGLSGGRPSGRPTAARPSPC